jgi:hypothetical protein
VPGFVLRFRCPQAFAAHAECAQFIDEVPVVSVRVAFTVLDPGDHGASRNVGKLRRRPDPADKTHPPQDLGLPALDQEGSVMYPRLKTAGLQMGRAMLVGTASGLRVWLHDKQPSQSIQPFRANVLRMQRIWSPHLWKAKHCQSATLIMKNISWNRGRLSIMGWVVESVLSGCEGPSVLP